jgi:predicted enzyme related to lactoylglutathione lyase
MKLYAVRIFVNDWERACQFYEHRLGLPVTFKDASLGWAEFDLGGPHLGLERVADDDDEGQALIGRFLGISLQVDDIADAYEQLKAKGVVFTEPPTKQPWGGSLAHFRDPEGNIITLLG